MYEGKGNYAFKCITHSRNTSFFSHIEFTYKCDSRVWDIIANNYVSISIDYFFMPHSAVFVLAYAVYSAYNAVLSIKIPKHSLLISNMFCYCNYLIIL